MTITRDELTMVQSSLDQLRDQFDTRSMYFYEALFKRAPHMKTLFRDDLAGQGMKFMSTLDVIVRKLDDEEALANRYKGLGETHAAIGIGASDFLPMEEALIDTLLYALGDDFTPELEAAWRKAYAIVSRNMIRRGGMSDKG
jgi:hemoglobin-like flavoprotein